MGTLILIKISTGSTHTHCQNTIGVCIFICHRPVLCGAWCMCSAAPHACYIRWMRHMDRTCDECAQRGGRERVSVSTSGHYVPASSPPAVSRAAHPLAARHAVDLAKKCDAVCTACCHALLNTSSCCVTIRFDDDAAACSPRGAMSAADTAPSARDSRRAGPPP